MYILLTRKPAQRNGLFREDGLRRTLEGKNRYVANMALPAFASFTDRCFGYHGRYELSRMKLQYSVIFSRVLPDYSNDGWVEKKVVMLRSETAELKHVAEGSCCVRLAISFVHLIIFHPLHFVV